MEKYDYVVLGGGVSGLGFAKRIAENGKSILVLEKEPVLGGLSRSVFYKGFYLDFCAHRFHTNNEQLLKEILELEGLKMQKHIKRSRIYMFGKYLKYPFELNNLLRAIPLSKSIVYGIDFLFTQIKNLVIRPKKLSSYKDWFVHFYGNHLYTIMCEPYTSKIWHTDPAELSADWADQRFQGENIKKLIKRIITKVLTLDFSSYSLEDDKLAPDGGPFYYPLHGIQELPDALARNAVKNGASIVTSATIKNIASKDKTVEYLHNGERVICGYKHLISTIPLQEIYNLQDKKSGEVEKAIRKLKYMDIIFVYLFLNKPKISNDHWLYFPDKDIIFNRAVEFSNWSPEMCPTDMTAICFDITSLDNNMWNISDKELINKVILDAEAINYINKENIVDSLVVKVKNAYPFYDLDYKNKLNKVVNFLESDTLTLLGRTGIFRYNNSDNSIEMGFELANQFLSDNKPASIYKYNIKNISL